MRGNGMKQPDLFQADPTVEVQAADFTKLLADRRAIQEAPVMVEVLSVSRYRCTFAPSTRRPMPKAVREAL